MTVFIPFDNRYRVTVSCPHCAQIVPLFASEESLRIASHEIPGGGGVCPESGKVLGRLQVDAMESK